MIFTMMAELAQAGVSYADMEHEVALQGFDRESILEVLSDDDDTKEKVLNLMRGLVQKELVETLSKKDDDVIKGNSKKSDAFGSSAKGPERLKPNPPGPPGSSKPINSGKPNINEFGGPNEGPGSGSAKRKPKISNRHLIEVPDGCTVDFPSWVGDGYCDMAGGYNT
jgi:hypothetical protein